MTNPALNHVLAKFSSSPWAMTPEGAMAWAMTFRLEAPVARDPAKNFLGDTLPQMTVQNGIAIVPVQGPLIHGAGFLDKGFGAMAHADIADMLDDAIEDSSVTGILLNVRSPGGTVAGTGSLGAKIAAIKKPVASFCDYTGASAAYWLMSQCDQIFCTTGAMIGSIGTLLQVTSIAQLLAANGISVETFASGNLKAAGSAVKPMEPQEREYFQNLIDANAAQFKSAVTAKRPTVNEDSMRGQVFTAEAAVSNGIADQLVSGLTEAVQLLSARGTNKTVSGAQAKTFPGLVSAALARGLSRCDAVASVKKSHPKAHADWLAQGGGQLDGNPNLVEIGREEIAAENQTLKFQDIVAANVGKGMKKPDAVAAAIKSNRTQWEIWKQTGGRL
ncbi:MAG TPA: S49 family peptidase [Verrucomicrobiae bacterium]|nr:S49 family peptidase [Verrucomicrobiae bacterium]